MLCLEHSTNSMGEICTNRCPERPTCHQHRIPFLIEAFATDSTEYISTVASLTAFGSTNGGAPAALTGDTDIIQVNVNTG